MAILRERKKQVVAGVRKPRLGNATRAQLLAEGATILAKLELLDEQSDSQ